MANLVMSAIPTAQESHSIPLTVSSPYRNKTGPGLRGLYLKICHGEEVSTEGP